MSFAKSFPVIDLEATGANILRLRQERGLTVRDLQQYFGFEEPQAIYKWQRGKSLPTVDNLYALSALLEVPMNAILVEAGAPGAGAAYKKEQPVETGCSSHIQTRGGYGGHGGDSRLLRPLSAAFGRCPGGRAGCGDLYNCTIKKAIQRLFDWRKRKSEDALTRDA